MERKSRKKSQRLPSASEDDRSLSSSARKLSVESKESDKDLPKTILSVGEVPETAPEKEFISDDVSFDFEDELKSEFENLDDIDLDNY